MKTLLLFLSLSTTVCTFAQENAEKEVKAVIDQLFDGMRTGDSAMVHRAFTANAGLRTTFFHKETGKPVAFEESLDEFLKVIGTPRKEVLDERTGNYVYHIDDNLAQVWMDYSFYIDDTFSHCGVNSVQLVRTEEGWKISDIADTRRKTNCSDL